MERFTITFEALLAALADAVKQLGDGSQPRWARTRVEEAKQDFIACCDIMCFQLKQAVEMIRAEFLQTASSSSSAQQQAVTWDNEQVQQLLEAAERFAAQLEDPAAAAAAAAAAPTAANVAQLGGLYGAGPGESAGAGAVPVAGGSAGLTHGAGEAAGLGGVQQAQYLQGIAQPVPYAEAIMPPAVAPQGMVVPTGDVQMGGQYMPPMAVQAPGVPAYPMQVYPGQNMVFKMET